MRCAGSSGTEIGWDTTIGMEVHVQLRTRTKMFCGCRVAADAPPNTRVCPVCLGLPGALPVPNERAVELGVRAAVALGAQVHERSRFERKNYFYPDLPKGYQITQYARPLATGGAIVLRTDGEERRVRVRRLHLEEDAGKSIHDRFAGVTAVDLNRAGVPLIEIVTEPDVRTPAEARDCLVRLKQVLEHYAAVSDCAMEEGSLRADANLSVRPAGAASPGTKTEVKNLNSFSFVERALEHERERQLHALRVGRPVVAETRAYDPVRRETRALREKEEAFDYRYFPEPDLPPLVLPPDAVERAARAMGEPPHRVEARLVAAYGLSEADAVRVAATPERAAYFESVVEGRDEKFARAAANFIMGKLAEERNRRGGAVREPELLPAGSLRRVVELRLERTLSSDTAGRALELLMGGGAADVELLVEELGLARVTDRRRLEAWVEEAVAAHREEAARYAAGEERLLDFFMGRVMRASDGRADPEAARRLLRDRLDEVG